MKAIGVNANNDIFIGGDGNIVIVSDLQAVLESCAHAVKAQYGEMILDIDQGVPNFETVWKNSANVPQYSSFIRRTLEAVPGVIEVTDLQVTATDNVLRYVATIKTVYGEGAFNAGL